MNSSRYFFVTACAVVFVSLLLHSCASGDGQSDDLDGGIDSPWSYSGGGMGGGGAACGNGIIDVGEQCDGANVGSETCASLGHGGGSLTCDPVLCTFDVTMCTNEQGGNGGYGG